VDLLASLRLWFATVTGRPNVRESVRARHERMAVEGRRRAEREGLIYDAYPEAPHRPKVRLVLLSGPFMERVDLDGYSLNDLDLRRGPWRDGRLAERVRQSLVVIDARAKLLERQQAKRRAEQAAQQEERRHAQFEKAVQQEQREIRRSGTR
jgi:hypothetical protein